MHKYIKCKHQHSGSGLLLTISTSVGKYLYAGELSKKKNTLHEQGNTLHRSRENAQPIREYDSGSIGSKEAHAPKQTSLGQARTHGVRRRRPRTACWTKLGAVGPPGRPTDLLVGRPGPWAPPPQLRHMVPPCWLLKSVLGASARGSLL